MLGNFIVFRLYLVIAICVLLPICYFITLELFNQVLYYLIFFKDVKIMRQNNLIIDDIYFLVNYFVQRRQWFKCLLMLQFYEYYKSYNSNKLLGIYFHNLSYNYIARYYYLKSLKHETDLELLQNLAYICRDLNDSKMLAEICCKINDIDSNNDLLMEFS